MNAGKNVLFPIFKQLIELALRRLIVEEVFALDAGMGLVGFLLDLVSGI
jgi:hypothetical protein